MYHWHKASRKSGTLGKSKPKIKERKKPVQRPKNIFKEITEEKCPNLMGMSIKVQKTYRTPNRLDQKRKSLQPIIIKTLKVKDKKRILKALK